MTVAELIKLLEQQNPDALVYVPSTQDGGETPLTEVEGTEAQVTPRGDIAAFYFDSGYPVRKVVLLR